MVSLNFGGSRGSKSEARSESRLRSRIIIGLTHIFKEMIISFLPVE